MIRQIVPLYGIEVNGDVSQFPVLKNNILFKIGRPFLSTTTGEFSPQTVYHSKFIQMFKWHISTPLTYNKTLTAVEENTYIAM